MRRLTCASVLLVAASALPASAQDYGLLVGTYAQSQDVSQMLSDSVDVGPDGTRTNINGVRTFSPAKPTSISNSSRNGLTVSSASVDLAAGAVSAFAEAAATVSAGSYQPMAMTQAQFYDNLRFVAAGAAAATITRVPFQVELHGVAVGDIDWTALLYSYSTDLPPEEFDGGFNFYYYGQTKNGGNPFRDTELVGSYLSEPTFTVDGDRAFISGYLSWTGPMWDAHLNMELVLRARAYADENVATPSRSVADFSAPVKLSLPLPNNVSLTSASGVLPSRTSAVPEPATWALMLMGFGLAGTALRRQGRDRLGAARLQR